jgi:uridine kinase
VPTLQRVLLEPFRLGGSTGFQLTAFDAARDTVAESAWTTAGPDAYLVLDGPFLQRPGLRGRFGATVYVESRWDEVPDVLREADALYQAEAGPRFGATALVDVTDPAHPRRVFADSC